MGANPSLLNNNKCISSEIVRQNPKIDIKVRRGKLNAPNKALKGLQATKDGC